MRANKQSKQCGASERVSGASERVNGRASGPVLTPGFFIILAHSGSTKLFADLNLEELLGNVVTANIARLHTDHENAAFGPVVRRHFHAFFFLSSLNSPHCKYVLAGLAVI